MKLLSITLGTRSIKFSSKGVYNLFLNSSYTTLFKDERFGRGLIFEDYGTPSKVLRIKKYERLDPSEDELEIRFLASPVNPSDVNQIEGVYPKLPSFIPNFGAVGGNEGVAQIIRLGAKIEESRKYTVGQWVLPSKPGFGTWRSFAIVKPDQIQSLPFPPNYISLSHAGTLSVNPCTAYRLLKDFVSLSTGDFIIQNGANSGVGRVVIQLCKAWGFKSINIVRDRENLRELVEELSQLGADYTFTPAELRKSSTRELLKTLNIKLGFNCVGGKLVTDMARFITPGGSLVTYGGMSREPVVLPTSLLIFNDINYRGFWMTKWIDNLDKNDGKARDDMWKELGHLMNANKIVEQPFNSVSWSKETSDESLTSLIVETAFSPSTVASNTPSKSIFFL